MCERVPGFFPIILGLGTSTAVENGCGYISWITAKKLAKQTGKPAVVFKVGEIYIFHFLKLLNYLYSTLPFFSYEYADNPVRAFIEKPILLRVNALQGTLDVLPPLQDEIYSVPLPEPVEVDERIFLNEATTHLGQYEWQDGCYYLKRERTVDFYGALKTYARSAGRNVLEYALLNRIAPSSLPLKRKDFSKVDKKVLAFFAKVCPDEIPFEQLV